MDIADESQIILPITDRILREQEELLQRQQREQEELLQRQQREQENSIIYSIVVSIIISIISLIIFSKLCDFEVQINNLASEDYVFLIGCSICIYIWLYRCNFSTNTCTVLLFTIMMFVHLIDNIGATFIKTLY